jgi:hypothetical protein
MISPIKNKDIPLKESHLEAKIYDSVASIKYTQTYFNKHEEPLECIYKFPCDPYFSVTGMHIKLDDKKIDAVIMEKEEAKEKYDDAVAAGHTAAKINYDENIPEVIELALGAVQPEKTVVIDVHMIAKWDVIQHGFFAFIFPINFIPKFNPNNEEGDVKARGNRLWGKFSCNIALEASSVISDLNVSHDMKMTQSECGKKVILTLESSKDIVWKDVVVSYSTEQIREPIVKLYSSDKHPDEVAAHITFIPRVSDEHEVEESKEEAKDSEDTVTEPNDDADDPEMASGEFIFILDRSGSMGGSRIALAKEALKLFIQSLPPDSKFNIVSFGTKYELMYKNSQNYEKKSIKETLEKIDLITANMGGTKMLEPMEAILKQKPRIKHPKNIFLLTDGAIRNIDEVVSVIRKYNYSSRVHSFGIGSGASRYLVKETAKAGLGTSALIADNDPQIKTKVIQALKLAAKPAFTDIWVDWSANKKAVMFQCPCPPVSSNIYEEEAFNIYAILKKDMLSSSSLTLSMFNTFTQDQQTLELKLDPSEVVDEGVDDCMFKMAAKENMVQIVRASGRGEKTLVDKQMLNLSLKYSVLSNMTAFFGKIKNKEKSGKEMKTISIPIKKMADSVNHWGHFMHKPRGGFGAVRRREANRGVMKWLSRWMPPKLEPQANSASLTTKGSKINPEKKKGSKYKSDKHAMKDAVQNDEFLEIDDWDEEESITAASKDIMPITEEKSFTSGYQSIVKFQDPQGFFTELPEEFTKYSDRIPTEKLENYVKSPDDIQKIWLTILAILLLEKEYPDKKGEWAMIVKKARSFIKKNTNGRVDINEFKPLLD